MDNYDGAWAALCPIEWEFDKPARRARVAVDGYLQTESAPLTIPATDDEQRAIMKLPGGFEYKEAEVAQATTLTSSGEIKYDWKGARARWPRSSTRTRRWSPEPEARALLVAARRVCAALRYRGDGEPST